MPNALDSRATSNTSLIGVLLRIWWMAGGAAALAIIAAMVATEPNGRSWTRDVAFVAIAISMVIARYFDVRWFKGETGDGQPATSQHFRSYSIKLLVISGLMLGAAHVLARL